MYVWSHKNAVCSSQQSLIFIYLSISLILNTGLFPDGTIHCGEVGGGIMFCIHELNSFVTVHQELKKNIFFFFLEMLIYETGYKIVNLKLADKYKISLL